MDAVATRIITSLGGPSEVARMLEAPISTVHSWKTNGIPASRLAHLKLAAKAAFGGAKRIDWKTGDLLHDSGDTADEAGRETGTSREVSTAAAQAR